MAKVFGLRVDLTNQKPKHYQPTSNHECVFKNNLKIVLDITLTELIS